MSCASSTRHIARSRRLWGSASSQRQRRHRRVGDRRALVARPAAAGHLPRVVGVGEGGEHEKRLVGPVAGDVVELARGREGDLLVVVGLHAGRRHPGVQHALHRVVPGQRLVERAAPVRRPVDVGGIDVGGQPLLEAVQLVGSDEVHLAGHRGVVAGGPQGVDDGRLRGRQLGGVVIDPDPGGEAAGEHRRARGRAQRIGAVGAVVDRRPARPAAPDGGRGRAGGRTPAATRRPAGRPSGRGRRAAARSRRGEHRASSALPATLIASMRHGSLAIGGQGGPDAAPLVVAHRGAWRPAPQNSLEAFEEAVQLGCDAIELDVRRTSDGRVVVVHDARAGIRPIAKLTHEELQARGASSPCARARGGARARRRADRHRRRAQGGRLRRAGDGDRQAAPGARAVRGDLVSRRRAAERQTLGARCPDRPAAQPPPPARAAARAPGAAPGSTSWRPTPAWRAPACSTGRPARGLPCWVWTVNERRALRHARPGSARRRGDHRPRPMRALATPAGRGWPRTSADAA